MRCLFLQVLLWKDLLELSYEWPLLWEIIIFVKGFYFWGLERPDGAFIPHTRNWLGHLWGYTNEKGLQLIVSVLRWSGLRWEFYSRWNIHQPFYGSLPLCLWHQHSLPQHPLLQYINLKATFLPIILSGAPTKMCPLEHSPEILTLQKFMIGFAVPLVIGIGLLTIEIWQPFHQSIKIL